MKFFYIIQACFFFFSLSVGTVSAETVQQQMMSLAAIADENGVIRGTDGWLFLQEELEHLGSETFYGEGVLEISKASKPEFADPLPAIVDFNQQLKERNITLVFAPIPPKALIYNDKLPVTVSGESITKLDQVYTDLYSELKKQGVQVLDFIPLFRAAKEKEQLYCKTDTHYSSAGLRLVANEFNTIIRKNDWYAEVRKKVYEQNMQELSIHGDLSVMQKIDTQEKLSLNFVTDAATGKAELSDPDSPVLLLGDSHTLVFSVGGDLHSRGAGLFDQLSADIKFPVDLLGVRGSGATPSRIKLYQRSRKEAQFLEKKKIIIWCLSARELTGNGGWRKIPVAKK